MKILYVGNDRGAAQRAAGVLRNGDQDVTVTWAGRLADALLWVRGNQDLGGLVVEEDVQNQSCVRFVRQVRALGLGVPILVVSGKSGGPLAALKAGADDYVVERESLSDLPGVLTRARQRSEARGKPAAQPLRFLYFGDSALARECFESLQPAIEVVEATPDSNGQFHPFPPDFPSAAQPLPFDGLLVEHGRPGVDIFAILKDVEVRRPQFPVILVVEWDEELIVPAFKLGAIDYVMKTRDSFRALVFRLDRLFTNATLLQKQVDLRAALQRATEQHTADMAAASASLAERQSRLDSQLSDAAAARTALEQKLAHTEMSLRAATQRHAAMTTAVAELHERRGQYENELAEAKTKRAALEQQLNDMALALDAAEQAKSSDRAAAERSAQREAELNATITEMGVAREALERRLADAETSLHAAELRATTERQTALDEAAGRHAELSQRLDEEGETRNLLEKRLAHAAAVVKVAAERHASMKSEMAELSARHAEQGTELARTVSDRDALEQQLREAATAFEQTERMRASTLAGTVERFNRREAQFVATIAETTAERDRLEVRLADLESTLKKVEQGAAAERESYLQAQSKSEIEFEEKINERDAELASARSEAAQARETFERRLSDAEATLKQSEQRALRERLIAVHEASERQAALQARLDDEVVIRTALEEKLANSTSVCEGLEKQLSDVTLALEQARHAHALDAKVLAETVAARDAFKLRIADMDKALQLAEERISVTQHEASKRQSELTSRLDDQTAARAMVEAQLAESTAACNRLEQQLSDTGLALERAKHSHARDAKVLAETSSARDALQRRVGEVEQALQEAEQRSSAALRDAAQQQNALRVRLDEESTAHARDSKALAETIAARDSLQHRLGQVEKAFHLSEERSTAALEGAIRRHKELLGQLEKEGAARAAIEAQLADSSSTCERLEKKLAETGVALERAKGAHARDSKTLAETIATRDSLQHRLGEVEEALHLSEERSTAALEEAARQQTELLGQLDKEAAARAAVEAQLAESASTCARLEKKLAETGVALERAKGAHARESKALAEMVAARDALQQHVANVEAELQRSEQQSAAALREASKREDELKSTLDREIAAAARQLEEQRAQHESVAAEASARLAHKESEFAATLAEMTAAGKVLEQRLAETEAVLKLTQERAAEDWLAAEHEASERQAEFQARLAERDNELAATRADAAQTRETLERRISETESSLQETTARYTTDMAAAAATLAEARAQYEAYETQATAIRSGLEEQVSQAASALEQLQRALESETATLAETVKARGALQHQLAETELALQLSETQASADRDAATQEASRARAEFEARLDQEVGKSSALELGLTEARAAADAAERHFLDEIAAMKQQAAEREAHLNEQIVRDRADRDSLKARLEAQIRQLEQSSAALRQSLDETHAAHQRHFEGTPSCLLRCSPVGTVEEVNQALATLLGYRTTKDLKAVDFSSRVFESSSDVQSLISRCLTNGATETVETTWKRKDGVRISVKLLAHASTGGTIEIVVEDLTSFRALEERLRQAQRMEAVGRLASEVATTCDHLLRDISQDGQEWLAMIQGESALRHQGELLLDEVTRAAGLLRQLELYGKKQASTLEPVEIGGVLRDLQPVLKRVLGEDIEFVPPSAAQGLKLAVEPERVERILVSVAAYGRERMPFGGRLSIEVDNVVVDREMAEQHSSLRPGAHALITVTAVRYAVRWDAAIQPAEGAASNMAVSDRPTVKVDLGAMQALIRECGGHLWMAADPPGDMVLKIHLPQSAVDVPADRRATVGQSAGPRPITKWFRTRH